MQTVSPARRSANCLYEGSGAWLLVFAMLLSFLLQSQDCREGKPCDKKTASYDGIPDQMKKPFSGHESSFDEIR
jgi:hypothetical protein